MKKISEIIRKMLETDFHVLQVIDVKVHADTDFDGDRILRVDVVFEGERKSVDAHKLAGVVRRVRPALLEQDEDGFPVFSFIAKKEMDVLSRESARHS